MPAKVISIDITRQIEPVLLDPGQDRLKVLLRLKNTVLGWVDLFNLQTSSPEISTERLNNEIVQQLNWKVVERCIINSLDATWHGASAPSTEPVSIVLCANRDAGSLQATMDVLLETAYPFYEVIRVDSFPTSSVVIQQGAEALVQHVHLETGGLNTARNLGIQKAKYPIIAFLDASVSPESFWLQQIANSFEPGVAGVIGYVPPSGWESATQKPVYTNFAAVKDKFVRHVFRQVHLAGASSPPLGWFGSGANMAFRREAFTQWGLFDPKYDTPDWDLDGGADDMFYRILKNNNLLVYEPSVLVCRRDRNT